MATLKLNGDTSGYVLLQAATVAQNNTLTLPNTTDTLVTSNGSVMNNATINGSTLFNPIITGSGTITGSLTGGTLSNTTLSSPTITGSWSQQNLNLVGTSALVGNGVYIPAANTVGFITNTTERMRLTSNGNLLVNTTATPLSGNATIVVSGLGTNGGGLQLAGGSAGGISQQSLNGGGLTWNTYTGAVGSETYAERMRLDSNGNLGVGVSTLSLGGRLTVGKASVPSFTGAASGVVTVSDTSSTLNSYTAIDFTNTNQQLPLARMAMQFTNSGSYLSLGTTNSYGNGINNNAVTIDPNSNVGVGTGAPGARLDVRGAATYLINSINPTAWFSSDATLSTQSMFNQFNTTSNVGIAGTYTNHPYVIAVNNIERLRVATTGFVGLGQPAAINARLTLVNTVDATAGSVTSLQIYNNLSNQINGFGTSAGNFDYRSVGNHVFYSGTGPTEYMRINSTGNVGIGSTVPQQTLDVAGNVNVLNTVIMGSSFLRNRIINGGMQIAQYGTSVNPGNTAVYTYSMDRWFTAINSGSASGYTISQLSQTNTGLSGFYNALRYQRNSGQTNTTTMAFGQTIETANCFDLAGQTATLSFWARAGSNFSAASSQITARIATGTGADQGSSGAYNGTWTGYAAINNLVTLTTSWTRYSIAVSIPSGTNEIQVLFYWAGVGTAGTNDYADFTGIQLEAGPVPTPFERRLYGTELALCQRYYYQYTVPQYGANFIAVTYNTTNGYAKLAIPVPLRTAPSLTSFNITGSGTWYLFYGGTVTSVTFGVVYGTDLQLNIAGTSLVANGATMLANSSTNAFNLQFSAEL